MNNNAPLYLLNNSPLSGEFFLARDRPLPTDCDFFRRGDFLWALLLEVFFPVGFFLEAVFRGAADFFLGIIING